MPDTKEHLEDQIWQFIEKKRPLKIFFIIVFIISLAESTFSTLKPTYSYLSQKAKYVFHIQPSSSESMRERNAFMAGIHMYQIILFHGSYEERMAFTIGSRHAMLKCFEALGFPGKEALTAQSIAKRSISENIDTEFEIRQRFEGHLESLGSQYKELFETGFYLSALISELQSSEQNEATITAHNNKILTEWKAAQDNLSYKLPDIQLKERKAGEPVIPQDILRNCLESMKAIMEFFRVQA